MNVIKLFTWVVLTFFHLLTFSQSINNYTFSSTNSTFSPLSGATIPVLTGTSNEGYYNNIPINFDFWFMGIRYTTVNTSTNGWLSFATISNAFPSNSFSSTNIPPTPFVAPLWDDLDNTQSGGIFSYLTSGNAPNRVFTAEWLNSEWNWSANTSIISFQVKLYETSGKVEFVYRQEAGAVNSGTASIGIAAVSGFRSLNGTGATPTVSNSISTNNLNTKPANGQIYAFSPPIMAAPSNLSFSNITQNSIRLNWADIVSGELGYVIYSSIDNIQFDYVAQTAANATLLNVTSLASGTMHYFRIYTLTEGGLSIPLSGSISTLNGTMSGVYNIPGNYTTITAAIAAILANGLASNVVFELQTTYNCVLETFPITFPANLGTTRTKTITIRPASNVTNTPISGSNALAMILFNGCKYVKFDGRPGGIGTNIALTINNDVLLNANTILFQNGATADSIMYCNIRGNSSTQSSNNIAVINFSTSTTAKGCDSNVIANCLVHGGDYNLPNVLIISSGTIGKENSLNLIINNHLYDYANTTSSFFLTVAAIQIGENSKNSTISGNHIYQSQSLTSVSLGTAMIGISVNNSSTGNTNIINNYIGGSGPFCSGNPWELGPISNRNSITAIDFRSVNTINPPSLIQGNVIANYLLGSTVPLSTNVFCGIYASGMANVTGNTIGATTGTASILVFSESTNTFALCGIDAISAISVTNNNIGAIEGAGSTIANPISIFGIRSSNVPSISNNFIGSLTTANSINASNNASQVQQVYGIQSSGNTSDMVISNNTISNLNNAGTSTSSAIVGGILLNSISNYSATVTGNLIQNLNVQTNNSISGISLTYSSSPFIKVSKNTVHSLKILGNSSTTSLSGISLLGSATNLNIEANFVHSFDPTTTGTGVSLVGINFTSATNTLVANNMIRLGIKPDGSSLTVPCAIYGISRQGTNLIRLVHNSIYIGGVGVGMGTAATGCYRNTSSGTTDHIFNNIFSNLRTNASIGGKHYSVVFANTIPLMLMNRNMHYTGSLINCMINYAGLDYTNFDQFKQLGFDQYASDSLDPGFINAIGNATTVNLHISSTLPTAVESNGTNTYTTIEDFDGQIRTAFSPVDIGADAGNFNQIALPVTWLDFKGTRIENGDVLLKWSTASEKNNSHFELERSLYGNHFEYIASIKGAGQSNKTQSYTFTDLPSRTSTSIYYRLKQIDFDGKTDFSKTIVVGLPNNQSEIIVYPNPFHDKLELNIALVGKTRITLTDVQGNLIWQEQRIVKEGETTLQLNTEQLINGIYFLSLESESGEIQHRKLLKK